MEVTFVNPGVDHMIQRIMAFQSEDTSPFWSEPLYHFYPQLDKAYAVSLPFPERRIWGQAFCQKSPCFSIVFLGLTKGGSVL